MRPALFLLLPALAWAEPTLVGDPRPLADGAEVCASCHADVAAQWSASAHHFSSFNNPYYRISVEEFRSERGARASRFCAGCHEPALLPTVEQPIDPDSKAAQAGVTCLLCHSIDGVSLEGNGGYHATLAAQAPGKAGHKARYRAAILDEPRLCAPCHKVGLRPDITHDRWLRGQDDWDAWLVSAASGNGAPSLFRPPEARGCQDCHMPLVPATRGDAATKNGLIRSHRFLGANAALPNLRGDSAQLEATRTFLAGKVSLDLRRFENLVDVVMHARGIGHRFPGGTMDSNQVWLEVRAFDHAGRLQGTSGVLAPDGSLPDDTHLVRAQPVDENGAPLVRRDPQHMRGVAFDASLGPSDPQAVRYRLPQATARVEARLLYRKFSATYARSACARISDPRCADVPVIEIARASLNDKPTPEQSLDHALALADGTADCAGDSLPLFDALPNNSIAQLGKMRALSRLGRTDELFPGVDHPAALFLQTNALLRAYRAAPARALAEKLAAKLPRDPTSLILLGRARGLDGDAAGSLQAADLALTQDPDLAEAHYQRSLALTELGRTGEAADARARWLEHRVSVETDQELRRRFLARKSGPDESLPLHVHELLLHQGR